MSARIAPIGPSILAVMLVAGCQVIGIESSPTVVRGSIYTEMHVGMPCSEQTTPKELSGIGLRFLDPAGAVIGTALSGPVEAREVPAPVGGGGDDEMGCRFSAPYSVRLPTVPSYTVEFSVPDPPQRGGYFSGTDELKTQTLSRDELAGRNFDWSFELPASYVVP